MQACGSGAPAQVSNRQYIKPAQSGSAEHPSISTQQFVCAQVSQASEPRATAVQGWSNIPPCGQPPELVLVPPAPPDETVVELVVVAPPVPPPPLPDDDEVLR